VCEVAFTEWTDADELRHPRYKGLRRDKAPEDVHKEAESQKAEL
jgi:ATP-dependent DNA ligase